MSGEMFENKKLLFDFFFFFKKKISWRCEHTENGSNGENE